MGHAQVCLFTKKFEETSLLLSELSDRTKSLEMENCCRAEVSSMTCPIANRGSVTHKFTASEIFKNEWNIQKSHISLYPCFDMIFEVGKHFMVLYTAIKMKMHPISSVENGNTSVDSRCSTNIRRQKIYSQKDCLVITLILLYLIAVAWNVLVWSWSTALISQTSWCKCHAMYHQS